jgi:DNA-binding GntR family transcriptional regulator
MDKLAELVRALKDLNAHVKRGEWSEARAVHETFSTLLAGMSRTEAANGPLRQALPRIRERYREVMSLVLAENEQLSAKLDGLGQKREGWLAYGRVSEMNG